MIDNWKLKTGNWKLETVLTAILPMLQCVTCGEPLRIARVDRVGDAGDVTEGSVMCSGGHTWPIETGVLVVSREDALSDNWSRTFPTYEAYAEGKAEALRQSRDDVAPLLARLPPDVAGPVVDVCTGQGALLFNMLDHLDPDLPVISVDMSPTIQTYNRRYLLENLGDRRGDCRVSFIACDVTTLPFREGVIACAVSFGMANMLDQLRQGVNEVGRVLALGGTVLFSHQFVEQDSEGWRVLTELMQEMGKRDFGYLGLEREFLAMMRRSPFDGCTVEVTRELVGDPDRDLSTGILPYPNEPLQEVVITAVKPGD